jgi:hypothetical protein
VVGYSFLWLSEHQKSRVEGTKDRPCVIVLATQNTADEIIVMVAPITHSLSGIEVAAVEIPATTKDRLGLDAERSWVIVSEVNRFIWPGPGLRPVSREMADRFDYGMLPPKLFNQITKRLVEHARRGRTALIIREQ